MTATTCRRPELHIEGDCERCEVDRLREALEEVTRVVMQEAENHRFGSPGYDMTLDHLHDVAESCREALGLRAQIMAPDFDALGSGSTPTTQEDDR